MYSTNLNINLAKRSNPSSFQSLDQFFHLIRLNKKIDQAQRPQYWMFDVGRSMFDV